MMRLLLLSVLLCISFTATTAQTKEYGHVYDATADVSETIKAAVIKAGTEHKNVMLQIGGNWCIWCIRFHHLVEKTDSLQSLMDQNYVVVYVNYDRKNSGNLLWQELGYPQRFGFPVFVVLDEKGHRLHIQDSSYLEDADGYSIKKVEGFLRQWSPAAVNGQF